MNPDEGSGEINKENRSNTSSTASIADITKCKVQFMYFDFQ